MTKKKEEQIDAAPYSSGNWFGVEPRPHICPVCEGRGTVPEGFYDDERWRVTTAAPKTCRTCGGRGIVWG